MKKILTLIVALSITSAVMAGNNNNLPFISMGVKFGLANEKQNFSAADLSLPMLNKVTTGYQAGIVLRFDIPLIPVYIQPELLYNWSKIKTNNASTIGDVKLNSFNIPLMVGVGFGSSNLIKIRANLGPVFNLASNVKIADTDSDKLKESLKKSSVSWAAGVGIDIFSIMFDVRYNAQFGPKETDGIKINPRGWTFSLGYLF